MRKFLCFLILILVLSPSLFSQEVNIAGKVLDENNDGLPGVNVLIKGTSTGTVTDMTGQYSITVPDNNSTLIFSYVGYHSQEIIVGAQTTIDVSLAPDVKALEEVVVVGYGTIPKSDLTGAVSSIKANDLPVSSTSSIDNLLQGKAAGLNLSMRSSQPGAGLDINIRGAISPNGSNAPLYVIDGIPITDNSQAEQNIYDLDLGYAGGIDRSPLATINPSDIESIDILKDASATAIYGSAAGNGVILITTKKGKEGKPKLEYNGYYTLQTPKKYYELLNATEFMEEHNRLAAETQLFNDRSIPYGTNAPGAFTLPYSQAEIDAVGEGTDWLDVIMRNGSIQEHNLSLTAGTENTNVFASFNYHNNKAVIENSDLVRYTGRVNLNQKVSDWINFDLKLSLSQMNSNNASTGQNTGGIEKYNMLQAAYSYTPTVEVFDEEGNYSVSTEPQIMNPAAFLIVKDELKNNRINIIPDIEFAVLEGVKLNLVGGLDRTTSNRNFYLPRKAQRFNIPDGMAQKGTNKIDNYSGEGYFTYEKVLGKSNLTVVAGAGYYKTITDGFFLVARDFFTDALEDNRVQIAVGAETAALSSTKTERTKFSQYFRINYSLNNKYIISAVGRRDGSSVFAENKKWGFFPGISAAWKINEENFLQNSDLISQLKLRAGYGAAGNETVLVGNANQNYSSGLSYLIGSTYMTGVTLSQVANPDLSWETDYTMNVGLDFGLWNNRVAGSFEYYNITAKDLLDFNPLPSNNPVGQVADNVGTTRSTGIELTLSTRNIANKSFKWATDFNISTNKSYWVERNPMVEMPEYIDENDEIWAIYGWETNGIIKTEAGRPAYMPDAFLGNVIYVDQNNDGLLNIEDVVKLGKVDPTWSLGLANSLTYKNFDLGVYMYGNLDRTGIYGYVPGGIGFTTTAGSQYGIARDNTLNAPTTAKDIWSSGNTDGIYPGVATNPYAGDNPSNNGHLVSSGASQKTQLGDPNLQYITDDFYLRKINFIRLKNITLGYTLPKAGFLNNISSARIYVNLENIAVITNYEGIDPEITEVNPYPTTFATTFGINVSF